MPKPPKNNYARLCGWKDEPRYVEEVVAALPHPVFYLAAPQLKRTGDKKDVNLAALLAKHQGGSIRVHTQTIGDCVSHGWGLGVDILKAVELATKPELEQFGGETVTEAIYAASRVEIGGGRLGSGDGSLGAWAAKTVQEYGVLLRLKYDRFDLRRYSGKRAKDWGAPGRGMPDELEPISKEHPVRTVSLVQSYPEARDAIASGYPVPVCSNQGFDSRRDSDGFARPKGQWAHCMLFAGCRTDRPGLLCINSWGEDWISGPKFMDQPEGSFWVDGEVCDKMLRNGDSFAISNFQGYPDRSDKFDYTLF